MIRKLLLSASLLAAAWPVAAHASWRTATSKSFVVYTEGSLASAKEMATKLEKFEFVMRFCAGVTRPDSPIKTRVYLVEDSKKVQATMPFGGSDGIAGYFDGSMRGPYAVMGRSDEGGQYGLSSQTVLFHELSHQFMFRFFPAAYPSWYTEGFADFYGTMFIGPKDVVEIGRPLENRYLGFQGNDWLPLSKLLVARTYSDVPNVYMIYSEGWLLVHYLSTTKNRPGQLKAYLNAINGGQSFEAAAKSAFGDIAKLDTELHDYAGRSKNNALVLPFKPIDVGTIDLRELSPAENALTWFDIRLSSGVEAAEAGNFADHVATAAKPFPDDPYALSILTDAQRLAGRDAAAMTTVDHWIKVAPTDGFALMNKAQLTIKTLQAAKVTDKAKWEVARDMLLEANRLNPNQPRILRAYYEYYTAQGILPPAGAQNGLVAAFELLPETDELRFMVAVDFENRGYIDDAIAIIRPLAFALRSEAEKTPKQKAREADAKTKYRLAGQNDDPDTARDVLARLERKKAEGKDKPTG